MMRKFQRTIEDFSCEKCGYFVQGSGYTNHCPQCLWSKHVDINPGDRLALCGGIMEPKSVEVDGDTRIIIHQCVQCNYQKRNKISKEDNFDVILEIMRTRNQ
ncbi:MAG: RNHCP domain-containing protein [Candidatus Yonathbacteria bacterium]|nr:RNHCP domain-containing protein [Candidatus Yonathbacteria bacterium]